MMMTEEEDIEHEPTLKSSIVANITCCFNGHHRGASLDGGSPMSAAPHHRRSSTYSSWFKSKANDAFLPENNNNKGRCRNLFASRLGRRRHSSADFSYDPLSYSLNFDQDSPSDAMMGFDARLARTSKSTTTLSSFHDHHHHHHHLPRSPKKNNSTGNNDLRKGFEALSVTMNRSKVANNNNNKTHHEPEDVTSSSPVKTTMSSSSNQEILVQMC